MSVGTILIIILILILIGALPTWPHSRSWGYGPGGIIGVILVVLLILLILDEFSFLAMIYIYESKKGKVFEINQPMGDPPLTKHPELGIPIKRVVTGGCGFRKSCFHIRTKLVKNDYKDSKFYKEKKVTVSPGGI